jgi:choline kinase
MKAVILAAGRGSRLKGHTENRPKCLVELAGRPLLSWQLEALARAGADDLAVVTGYRGGLIAALADRGPAPFTVLENPRWAETNMLSSLLCAAGWAEGQECLISYSDIVYPARHVTALRADAHPVALTYDLEWERLWRLRSGGDPLADAETFRAEGGLLKEIGGRPASLDQVRGQYMGLLKLAPEGWTLWLDHCRQLGDETARTDLTGFLRRLLAAGAAVGATAVSGAWCEVDSDRDLELYETALAEGNFSHDWRE